MKDKEIKILHLTVSGDLIGGGDTIISNILSEKRKDTKEYLATLLYSDFMNELCIRENIYYYNSGKHQSDTHFVLPGRFWAIEIIIRKIFFIYNLSKIIKKEKINIIHAHGFPSALAAIIVKKFSSIKIIYTHHFFRTKPSNTESFILKSLYNKFNANTAVSKTVCESLNTNLPKLKQKFEVVYNCVAPVFFEKKNKNDDMFLQQKIKGQKIFVQAARFHLLKNQILVAKAVKTLPAEIRKKIFVVFLGEGSEKNIVEDYIIKNKMENNFFFMGAVSPEKVPNIMSNCDYGLFPSELEGFGLGAVECLAKGLPVIALNNQLMQEIVGEGGILAEKNTLDKAFIKMLEISDSLKDKAQQQSMKFTPQKMKDNYISIYKKVLIL